MGLGARVKAAQSASKQKVYDRSSVSREGPKNVEAVAPASLRVNSPLGPMLQKLCALINGFRADSTIARSFDVTDTCAYFIRMFESCPPSHGR